MKRILALTMLGLAIGASAQNFGPPVIDRPMLDQAFQITFISGVHAAPAAGEISEWRLWASGTGDVTLQMWRPISGGFQLVGFNAVTVTSTGFNTIAINSGRIAVQAGDVIGFRYNQTVQANRVIDFAQNAGGSYRWTFWPSTSTDVPIGGVLADTQLTGLNEAREYSLAATVVPEPATLAVVLAGSLALTRRRRR